VCLLVYWDFDTRGECDHAVKENQYPLHAWTFVAQCGAHDVLEAASLLNSYKPRRIKILGDSFRTCLNWDQRGCRESVACSAQIDVLPRTSRKSYKRQDARLKHYRKAYRHVAPGPALTRLKYWLNVVVLWRVQQALYCCCQGG